MNARVQTANSWNNFNIPAGNNNNSYGLGGINLNLGSGIGDGLNLGVDGLTAGSTYAPISASEISFGNRGPINLGSEGFDAAASGVFSNEALFGNNGGGGSSMWSQDSMFGEGGWFSPAVKGFSALGNMYLGYQALNAQEDYMNDQIRLAEQQLANSETSYNNSYDRIQQAAANSMSNEALGLPADATPEQRQQAQQAYVENQKVNHVGTQNG
jgi:hypothetical protein